MPHQYVNPSTINDKTNHPSALNNIQSIFFSFLYKYKVNKWFEGHEKTQIVIESSIHLSNGPEWSRFINYFYFFLETDLSTIDGTVIIFFFGYNLVLEIVETSRI